jgi:hypothetical protein
MADEDKIQTDGRKRNAAQPLNASGRGKEPERYPAVRQDDAVEPSPEDLAGEGRSFDPAKGAPSRPPQGAGDTSPPSTGDGRLGPGGDPAEGKR